MRYFAIAAGFGLAVTAMLALGAAQAAEKKAITSDGKCWLNTSNGNYSWTACKPDHAGKGHHKG